MTGQSNFTSCLKLQSEKGSARILRASFGIMPKYFCDADEPRETDAGRDAGLCNLEGRAPLSL
jgi:hypothetical protein